MEEGAFEQSRGGGGGGDMHARQRLGKRLRGTNRAVLVWGSGQQKHAGGGEAQSVSFTLESWNSMSIEGRFQMCPGQREALSNADEGPRTQITQLSKSRWHRGLPWF